jgi:hypothetical protein
LGDWVEAAALRERRWRLHVFRVMGRKLTFFTNIDDKDERSGMKNLLLVFLIFSPNLSS